MKSTTPIRIIGLQSLAIISFTSAIVVSAFQVERRRCMINKRLNVDGHIASPVVRTRTATNFSRQRNANTQSSLHALIYGWDDGSDDGDAASSSSSSNSAISSPTYYDEGPGAVHDFGTCSPEGVAVAESLSYDGDRRGALARLAVAFCPPGQALTLDQIEQVEVVCVGHDHIDIQAIICESHGCVSLAVPVKFPHACDANDQWLEGCVRQNLFDLDGKAQTELLRKEEQQQQQSGQDHYHQQQMYGLGGSISRQQHEDHAAMDYPSWWVFPAGELTNSCVELGSILNEDEFQPEVVALAKDSLHLAGVGGYNVRKAKVAAVGPAGLAFQVDAEKACGSVYQLDVMYPFGGNPSYTSEDLRAVVLGAVAMAEGTTGGPQP